MIAYGGASTNSLSAPTDREYRRVSLNIPGTQKYTFIFTYNEGAFGLLFSVLTAACPGGSNNIANGWQGRVTTSVYQLATGAVNNVITTLNNDSFNSNTATDLNSTVIFNNGNSISNILDLTTIQIDCTSSPNICSKIQQRNPAAPGETSNTGYEFNILTSDSSGNYWNAKVTSWSLNGNIMTLTVNNTLFNYSTTNTTSFPSQTGAYNITVIDGTPI